MEDHERRYCQVARLVTQIADKVPADDQPEAERLLGRLMNVLEQTAEDNYNWGFAAGQQKEHAVSQVMQAQLQTAIGILVKQYHERTGELPPIVATVLTAEQPEQATTPLLTPRKRETLH